MRAVVSLFCQRQGHDLLAKLLIRHAGHLGGLGDQAVGGHAGEGVDLQTPGAALRVQNEVGAGVDGQAQCMMKFQSRLSQQAVLLLRAGGGAELPGRSGAALVLGHVVEGAALRRHDLMVLR